MKITSIGDFINTFDTTLASNIYSAPAWENDRVAKRHELHELTHVMQWSIAYAIGYVVSQRRRAYYETLAWQASVLPFMPKADWADDGISFANGLVRYGIEKDIALQEINDRLTEISSGKNIDKLHPSVAAVVGSYVEYLKLNLESLDEATNVKLVPTTDEKEIG